MDNENAHVVQWLEENREDSYFSEVGRDRRLASIFMVPISLKENDVIFAPQAISIGPYHFLKPHLAEMEFEKSQIVAREVMRKLPPDFFAPLQQLRNGESLPDLQADIFFGSVAPCCWGYYGDPQLLQNLTPEAFAMMMFRDASFLLVFLEHYVANSQKKRKLLQSQQSASDNGDPFHDLKSGTSLWLSIMEDVIKLENQIPLSALESLYAFIGDPHQQFEGFVTEISRQYSPLWIKTSEDRDLRICRHLLHCIHATVYRKRPMDVGHGPRSGQRPTNGWSPFTWLKNNCLWVRGRNSEGSTSLLERLLEDRLRYYGKTALPSALKLRKAGVKFRHCNGGIEDIRFDSAQSTLYLPQLRIGIMTETIIRNLIAFELCSPEIEENAVIGFTRLLKELTQDDKDAEVLRKSEILVKLGVSDDKMVDIVKSLSSSTWNPYCKPVNDARKSLNAYYERNSWKFLWSEVLDTYWFKVQPWVFYPALAATLLLVLTAVQVYCLFCTCNKNS